jgi:phosphoribosyl 1,2-cyclic phosphodiesterase
MKVTIWGCRGSIAAPGRETVRYGGESTCVELVTDDDRTIIIDAGSGIRKLGNVILKRPGAENLTLLLTHSHWDHLAGFPFFKPAFVPRFTITLCGGPDARNSVARSLSHQMQAPYFPVDMSAMRATFVQGCQCECESCDHSLAGASDALRCDSIPLNHPNGGYGFKFTGTSGKTFVFLTDNEIRHHHETGLDRAAYVNFCRGADLLLHDAQYTEEEYKRTITWGHSTFRDALDIAIDAGVRQLGLVHHDPDRTDDQIDVLERECKDYLREKNSGIDCFACAEGMTFEL